MLIVPRFYHIYRRSGAKIVAVSGHLEVKKSICVWARPRTPQGEFTAHPRRQLVGRGSQPTPQELHPASAFRALAHHLPSPGKSCGRPCKWCPRFRSLFTCYSTACFTGCFKCSFICLYSCKLARLSIRLD